MHIQLLPHHQYLRTVLMAVAASMLVVGTAAFLGRATLNLRAALNDKPDLAIFLLLGDKEVTQSTLLRETEDGMRRDYLIETKDGPEFVILEKGEKEWFVATEESLRAE